jgi:hypothetical protein
LASPTKSAATAHDVLRAGWGLYTDFAYTNQNALNAAIDGGGRRRHRLSRQQSARHSQADGSFFRVSDPLSTIARRIL